jgi:hypothetical protein
MTTTTFAEGNYTGEFLVSESPQPNYSREVVTLAAGQNLGPGTVLGKITTGSSAAVAAFAHNASGTGTIASVTVSAGAKPGAYKVVMIGPGSGAGTFTVEDPDGVVVGTGAVGSAFSGGGLAFTVADGTPDFVAGEGFTITVAAGAGTHTQFNQDAANGSQHAAGILYGAVDASGGAASAVAIVRDAIVNGDLLVWPSDIEAGEKAAAIAELKALGILVR